MNDDQTTTIYPRDEVACEAWLRSYLFLPRRAATLRDIAHKIGFDDRTVFISLYRMSENGTKEIHRRMINGFYWIGFGDPSSWKGVPSAIDQGRN